MQNAFIAVCMQAAAGWQSAGTPMHTQTACAHAPDILWRLPDTHAADRGVVIIRHQLAVDGRGAARHTFCKVCCTAAGHTAGRAQRQPPGAVLDLSKFRQAVHFRGGAGTCDRAWGEHIVGALPVGGGRKGGRWGQQGTADTVSSCFA